MQASELPLRDIHLPEAVSWWPPAMGWWIVLFLFLSIMLLGFWLHQRQAQAKKAVVLAKKTLAELKRDKSLDGIQKLTQISILLRRVAMSVSNDAKVAGLTGQAWLEHLDATLKSPLFCEGVGRLLLESPYRQLPPTETEMDQLFHLCKIWLKTCRKSPKTKTR